MFSVEQLGDVLVSLTVCIILLSLISKILAIIMAI